MMRHLVVPSCEFTREDTSRCCHSSGCHRLFGILTVCSLAWNIALTFWVGAITRDFRGLKHPDETMSPYLLSPRKTQLLDSVARPWKANGRPLPEIYAHGVSEIQVGALPPDVPALVRGRREANDTEITTESVPGTTRATSNSSLPAPRRGGNHFRKEWYYTKVQVEKKVENLKRFCERVSDRSTTHLDRSWKKRDRRNRRRKVVLSFSFVREEFN